MKELSLFWFVAVLVLPTCHFGPSPLLLVAVLNMDPFLVDRPIFGAGLVFRDNPRRQYFLVICNAMCECSCEMCIEL